MERHVNILIYGCILHVLQVLREAEGLVFEKTATACNGPCGQLSLFCPPRHRMAIRDAFYSFQKRPSSCKSLPSCNRSKQEVCCDQTSQDCVASYSQAHLKQLQRNCTGAKECVLKASRPSAETGQCLAPNSQPRSTHTNLNYICISDNVVSEICSPKETIIHGKTLFALMDSSSTHRPNKGSACTCIAESTKWPTTSTIVVFIVGIRLNITGSSECANASLSVRSGEKEKNLSCQSDLDSRMSSPFVALVNNSNVATVTLDLGLDLPEFIWLGFEANENEDIRLTCKFQGLSPVTSSDDDVTLRELDSITDYNVDDDDGKENYAPNNEKIYNKGKDLIPAIIGGVVAGVVLTVIVVAVIILIRRKKHPLSCTQAARSDAETDVTYYTTTEVAVRSLHNNNEEEIVLSYNRSKSEQELYVSPESVVANKRRSDPETASGNRLHGRPDDTDYVSCDEILERKRQSHQPKSGTRTDVEHGYDRLNRHSCSKLSDIILESYDQLQPEKIVLDSYSLPSEIKVQTAEGDDPLVKKQRDVNYGTVDVAYQCSPDVRRSRETGKARKVKDQEMWFRPDGQSSASHSNASYIGIQELPPLVPKKATGKLPQAMSEPVSDYSIPAQVNDRKPSISNVGDNDYDVYTDAKSEAANEKHNGKELYASPRTFSSKRGIQNDVAKKKTNTRDGNSDEPFTLKAAPRRKSRENFASAKYGTAQPTK